MQYQVNFSGGRKVDDTILEDMIQQDCDNLGSDFEIPLPDNYTLTREQLENKRKRKSK